MRGDVEHLGHHEPASSEAPSATGLVSMPAIVSRSATSRGPAVVSTNSRSQRYGILTGFAR